MWYVKTELSLALEVLEIDGISQMTKMIFFKKLTRVRSTILPWIVIIPILYGQHKLGLKCLIKMTRVVWVRDCVRDLAKAM